MRDIRTKESNREPKIKNLAARMPKELVRTAALEAKKKSHQAGHSSGDGSSQESPAEYASGKITSAEEWATMKAGGTAVFAGRKLAKKSYEKIRERRRDQNVTEATREAEDVAGNAAQESGAGDRATEAMKDSVSSTGQQASDPRKAKIKLKPEAEEGIRQAGKTVKSAPRIVKTSPVPHEQIKTSQMLAQKKQALKTMQAAKASAKKSAQTAQATVKAAKTTARGVKAAVDAVVSSARAIWMLLASSVGGIILFLIIVLGIIGGVAFSGSSQSAKPLSSEVLAYTATIQKYADEYGIPEYVPALQAIMMQESGGRGTDPMQSSECPYNTRYANVPNAIQDPEYSIQVGVQYYAGCVSEAGCQSPNDMERLKLSWQGYNYGNGYISWALRNYGGYSETNALIFSQEQAAKHGWPRYGDPEYAPHVLQYYSGGGNLFAGLFGNDQIVTIAKAQIGNAGGQKFWSWYGFSSREAWCACFVSWCADQSGLIEAGKVPRFALCMEGADWFKSQGRWKDRGYNPTPGTIIFFDWNGDGWTDHVGIVEKCENGTVYTIEGNSGDQVRERSYPVGSSSIFGYGLLN